MRTGGPNGTSGSLTLGGYDSSRFIKNDVSFSLSPLDPSAQLTVEVQSIRLDFGVHLSISRISMSIDSTVPYISLPIDVCQAFEQQFGLIYNEAQEFYQIPDASYELLSKSGSFIFNLGQTFSGGKTVDISLPYNNLVMPINSPFIPNVTRYFPLSRPFNSTSSLFIIGRVFLQEA